MSFHRDGDMFDDETPLLCDHEYIFESPEPCLLLRPQNHQHQHQARHQQQQLGNSYESWLRENLLNLQLREQQRLFSQSMLSSYPESNVFTMNQIAIGQQVGQGNGFVHPTMACSHGIPTLACSHGVPTVACSLGIPTLACSLGVPTVACSIGIPTVACSLGVPIMTRSHGVPTITCSHGFPYHLQRQVLQVPLIQQESSDAFGTLFPQHSRRFPSNNLPVITTTSIPTTSLNRVHMQQQQQYLCAPTLSTREHLVNNQYHNYYALDQIMAVNTEHSNPIAPSNLIPNRSQNYMPHQTYSPIASSFTMSGQQLPPSVLANRPNEAQNLRTVNNSARNHGSMQRRMRQSSSGFRFSTSLLAQLLRSTNANSSIALPSVVLGIRRRSYEGRSEFGEPSSSTRRRITISAEVNVGSTATDLAEQRGAYEPNNPDDESRGLCIDPHSLT